MKAVLYSTASAVALIALSGAASAGSGFSGVVQLSIGRGSVESATFFDGKGDSSPLDSPFAYAGEARGLWPLSNEIHIQADLFAEQADGIARNWGRTDEATAVGGAVHLLHPFENRARFGLAGAIWNNEILAPVGNGQSDVTYGLIALEAQFFGADWTLMGQVGTFTSLSQSSGLTADCDEFCPEYLRDGTFLRAGAKYFLTDNTALNLETVQMWGGTDDVFSGKSLRLDSEQWVVGAEHRFEGSSFSAFLDLSHEKLETLLGLSTEVTSVSLGVRFFLDQDSLKSNDRSGAELDTPRFGYSPEFTGVLLSFPGPSAP